ncbi:flagellar protein essential for flagellar pocket biogenesis [Diplonema papillatum]|nr:flagellar protein essential for flagellar pocket biogenesis [Diplonema papillatum]
MFVVLVAADLGSKLNFEIPFPALPGISELREKIINVLTLENASRRPNSPPFQFHRAQVFDERMEMWVDLVASSQLEDYCQIYIFQKETAWHKDTTGRIPPPTKSAFATLQGVGRTSVTPPPTAAGLLNPADQLLIQGRRESLLGSVSRAHSLLAEPSPVSVAKDNLAYHTSLSRTAYLPPLHSYQPASPTSGTPLPVVAGHEFSGTPSLTLSFGDKIRLVFEEFALNANRAVNLEQWVDCFTRLRINGIDGLTQETVEDLFRKKADRNEDGLVTLTEFQQFAVHYPKLIDCLHFRSKRHRQEALKEENKAAQYRQLELLESRLHEVRQSTVEAEAESAVIQQKVDEANGLIERAKREESQALSAKSDATKKTEDAKSKLREAKAHQVSAQNAYKKVEVARKQADRGTEVLNKRLQQQSLERERVARELERLMKLVREQERELEKKGAAMHETENAIRESMRRADSINDPALESQKAVADQGVKAAEAGLKGTMETESECAVAHKQAQRAVQNALAQKVTIELETQEARVKQAAQQELEGRAERLVNEHRSAIDDSEAALAEELLQNDEEEAKENELLQMEVRLREQREAVEQKEEVLRTAHLSFSEESGRVSPRRAMLY